jgi:putative phage-type endonuclease
MHTFQKERNTTVNLLNIEQGSPEWVQARCGSVGASIVADVMSKGKDGKESTGYANLRARIVAERLTGCVIEGYTNTFMERGNVDEGSAREVYEFVTGNAVEQVGLIRHPAIPFFHASPDGLIGEDGILELKRKIPALHIDYLLKKRVPPEYIKQMTAQLSCSGRSYVEFASYCPELSEEYQFFTIRMYRDEEAIKAMEAAVIAFNESVERMIADLKAIRP